MIPTTSSIALRLYLSHLRSQHRVAAALASKFPTPESWLAFLGSDEVSTTFDAFAGFIDRIRAGIDEGAVVDFNTLEQLGNAHLDEGLAAVASLAAELEVDPQELLTTLVYG